MFRYTNVAYPMKSNYLHSFLEQKSEYWIKPSVKFLFHFDDTLKVFIEGIFLSLHKSENTINSQKYIYVSHICYAF